MSKDILVSIILLIGTLAFIFCDKDRNKNANECEYNFLDGCEGKCCRNCEFENICKIVCRNNPENCGGKINK